MRRSTHIEHFPKIILLLNKGIYENIPKINKTNVTPFSYKKEKEIIMCGVYYEQIIFGRVNWKIIYIKMW